MRISYEQVALFEALIFSNTKNVDDAMIECDMLLEICGWTKEAYEEEQAKRIDKEYDVMFKEATVCHSN